MNRDWMHRLVGTLAISFALSQVAWGQGVFDDDPGANVNDFPEFNDQGTQPSAEQAQQIAEQVQNLNNDARSLVQQGNVEAAILKYEEALAVENSPGNFESHFERGKLLREQGYIQEALNAYGLAQAFVRGQEPPVLVAYYLELGEAYVETEQFNTAISILNGAINQLPGQTRNPELWFQLGVAQSEFAQSQQFTTPQQQAEDLQKALSAFDRAVKLNPNYAEALFERGMTHSMLGDIDKSIEDLERAVELDPSNEVPIGRLGFATLSRALNEGSQRKGDAEEIEKDLQQAVTQFTKFLNLVPALPPGEEPDDDEEEPEIRRESVLLQRSAAFIALGEEAGAEGTAYYRNAVADAEAAIEETPDAPDGYFQKGMALRLLNDFPAAIEAFSEVVGINPTSYQGLLRRGIIYYRQNELESAIADLEKAIQYSGGMDSRAHFWLAVCLAAQERHGDASVHYSRAIRFNPSLTTAYFNRGLSHLHIGRLTRAKSDFNEVLRRDPKNLVARQMRDKIVELQSM